MEFIEFTLNEGVATLSFNRPDKYNAFVRKMAFEVQDALKTCQEDENIRAVIITGKGKAFCAGEDLAEATDPNGPDMSKIVTEHFNPIIRLIRSLDKPVIAAVNGVAAGAGANIALACDIVMARNSASFIQAFSKIGLIPDSGGTYFLPRLIGMQRASALMMLAEPLSAQKAEEIGMIYKAVDDEEFDEEVHRLATHLAQMPTLGLALTKQALNQSYLNSLDQQLELEDQLQTLAGHSEDYREGVAAFFEKRKPHFKGK
jgi:2-(1,2-epoxy-1,2-dihydrophenyl)acetyl-CoA isomerase